MTPEQKAAFIFAKGVSALADIAGMQAFNQERLSKGMSIGYDETAFSAVVSTYGLGENDIISFFKENTP
jgi:hypothetical protein